MEERRRKKEGKRGKEEGGRRAVDQQDGEVGEVVAVADNGAFPVCGLAALCPPAACAACACRRAAVGGWHSGQGTGTSRGHQALPGLPGQAMPSGWHGAGIAPVLAMATLTSSGLPEDTGGIGGILVERGQRGRAGDPLCSPGTFWSQSRERTLSLSPTPGKTLVLGTSPAHAGGEALLTSTMSCQNWISTGWLSPATCPLCRKAPSTSSFSTELLWASCKSRGACRESPLSPGHPTCPEHLSGVGVLLAGDARGVCARTCDSPGRCRGCGCRCRRAPAPLPGPGCPP